MQVRRQLDCKGGGTILMAPPILIAPRRRASDLNFRMGHDEFADAV